MNFFRRFRQLKKDPVFRQQRISFRERLNAMRHLPAFFKLVWETSPRLTIANALLRIMRSATPLLILYTGKLIIDQVVNISRSHGSLPQTHLWQLVGIEFAFAVL